MQQPDGFCSYCCYLHPLTWDGRLPYHRGGCEGSGEKPETLPLPELSAIAFSSSPVIRVCRKCGRRVEVITGGAPESHWRYSAHRTPASKMPAGVAMVDCPASHRAVNPEFPMKEEW